MGLTTTDLLAAVRREAFLPDASDQDDTDLLAFADDALATLIASTIRPGREGRWLTHSDITIVPGTYEYTMPRRALGQTVRGVRAYRPDGTSFSLTETDPLELRDRFDATTVAPGDPRWYAFEDQTIRIGTCSSTSGWFLRVFYLRSPAKLVLPSACGLIVSVYELEVELDVTVTPPSTITANSSLVDIVSGEEPYLTVASDLVVSTFSTPALEFVDSISGYDIAAQTSNRSPDYVCPAEQTCYPPIARALWPALVRATASACLEATRDDGAAQMSNRAELARRAAVNILEPRDDRRSRSIVGDSTLRAGRRGRRWW